MNTAASAQSITFVVRGQPQPMAGTTRGGGSGSAASAFGGQGTVTQRVRVGATRGSSDTVNAALQNELTTRLQRAGIEVLEGRLSHLAYAPEIAGAMLQRQQAEAILDARKRIVDGAVGMVQMALEQLRANDVVQLDEERKAQMVSNLLVVLCSERGTQPVVNAGTLYG